MSVVDANLPFELQRRGYSPEQVKDYLHRLHLRFERNIKEIDNQRLHIEKTELEVATLKKELADATRERDRVTDDFEQLSATAAANSQAADSTLAATPAPQVSARLQQILTLAEEEATRITEEAASALELAQAEAQTIRKDAEQSAIDARAAAEADVRQIYSDRNDVVSELLDTSERLRALLEQADITELEDAGTPHENDQVVDG